MCTGLECGGHYWNKVMSCTSMQGVQHSHELHFTTEFIVCLMHNSCGQFKKIRHSSATQVSSRFLFRIWATKFLWLSLEKNCAFSQLKQTPLSSHRNLNDSLWVSKYNHKKLNEVEDCRQCHRIMWWKIGLWGEKKNEHSQDIFNNNIVMICLTY